jgi:hypothetical protein
VRTLATLGSSMRRVSILILLVVACSALAALLLFKGDVLGSAEPPVVTQGGASERPHASKRTLARMAGTACGLRRETLLRVWRGQAGNRSPDVILIPKEPNFFGGFSVPNHSGPADNLQQVPLVLYGPGRIQPAGVIRDRHASITDVYPTVGELTRVGLPDRAGDVLREALVDGTSGRPRLILVIVWDGVGRNVLRRWPHAWPTLASLERSGTSYLDATVGSSPSITPATHANLGTGAYPRQHRVPAIYYRTSDGRIAGALAGSDPAMLELTTFADEIDRRLGNRPLVGMLGWFNWHLPMMGHGKGIPGGDADQVGLIHDPGKVLGNDDFYSTPQYLDRFPGFEKHARRLDRSDGALDGEWLGNNLYDRTSRSGVYKKDNPAWVAYQTDMLLAMLRKEGYGDGHGSPDMFFTNFKMADVVGHQYIMDSPEMRAVLRSQDAALSRILDYLDATVKDYVVVVTADHGHTPSPERTGAWPISTNQIAADVDAYFGVQEGRTLVVGSRTAGLFLDRQLLRELSLDETDVAGFLLDYTVRDNWGGARLPEGYEDRGAERVFSGVFARSQLPSIMRCAYGADRPPPHADD